MKLTDDIETLKAAKAADVDQVALAILQLKGVLELKISQIVKLLDESNGIAVMHKDATQEIAEAIREGQ